MIVIGVRLQYRVPGPGYRGAGELRTRSVGFVEASIVLEISPTGLAPGDGYPPQGKDPIFPFPERHLELMTRELADSGCREVDGHTG